VVGGGWRKRIEGPNTHATVVTPLPLDVKYSRIRVIVGFDFGR
jgi:hypothetical protein